MSNKKLEDFLASVRGLGLAHTTVPAWQWRMFEELETRRAKLSYFCTPEQIKELEQIAFERASRTLHSNHDVVCAVLDEAYQIFASGGGFEQVTQETKLLNNSNQE